MRMFRNATIRGRSGMEDAISGATFESWFQRLSDDFELPLDARFQEIVRLVVGERLATAEVFQQPSSMQRVP